PRPERPVPRAARRGWPVYSKRFAFASWRRVSRRADRTSVGRGHYTAAGHAIHRPVFAGAHASGYPSEPGSAWRARPVLVTPAEETDLAGANGPTIMHSPEPTAPMRPFTAPLLAIMATLAAGLPGVARAQEVEPSAHAPLAAGLYQWELEGDGLTALVAIRAGTPVSTVLLLEGSLIGARPGQESGTTTVLIPEGQFQLALPFTGVNPYMGLGGGAFVDIGGGEDGGTAVDMTISASLGFRVWLGE